MIEYDFTALNKEVLKMLDDLSVEQKTSLIGPKLSEALRPIYAYTRSVMNSTVKRRTGTLHASLSFTDYNWSKTDKGVIQASFYIKDLVQPKKRGRYQWHSVDYGRFVNDGTAPHSNVKGTSSKKLAKLQRTYSKQSNRLANLRLKARLATSQTAYRNTMQKIANLEARMAKNDIKISTLTRTPNISGLVARRYLTSAWDNNQEKLFTALNQAVFDALQEIGTK